MKIEERLAAHLAAQVNKTDRRPVSPEEQASRRAEETTREEFAIARNVAVEMAEAEIREQARQDKVFLAYAPDDEEDLASPSPEEIEAQMEAIKSRWKPEDYERRRRYRPPPIVDEELCRPRLCVSCNQLFTSYGPGNRRCESCILATADLEGDHERERIRRCGGYGSICFDGEGDDIGD